mmetsp:Transcript_9712/g.10454  ORF Transcript_9712/g.10454 Transcript_9712/m.10454 type:complete len:1083 (-) Transcript_9712:318-3566(-)
MGFLKKVFRGGRKKNKDISNGDSEALSIPDGSTAIKTKTTTAGINGSNHNNNDNPTATISNSKPPSEGAKTTLDIEHEHEHEQYQNQLKQEEPISNETYNELNNNIHSQCQSTVSYSNSKASSESKETTLSATVALDDKSDVSSIGSGTAGEGHYKSERRPLAANGSSHRSRLSLGNSSSVIGLDSLIESRREEGGLTSNVVHMEVPFGKPIEEVYDGVQRGPVLGSGISGVVRLVTHKATGVKYAVKCLDLGLVDTEEGLMQLREEIFIMCQLDHPNIVRLEEVYESHTEIYLVQELCLGGELFDRLDEQPDYHYTEAECARLLKQMLSSVRYLHSKGIIHRDLKLENFLFSSSSQDSELKMIDFGLSKHFRYGEVHHEAVGTPYTVAPEVIKGKYDERCDIWAIGVIAFLLFSGDPPFGGCGGSESLMEVRQNILDGEFEFEPAEVWDLVSDLGKKFVEDLLVTDPKKRPTAREAQKHAWLTYHASRNIDGNRQENVLNPNVVKALVNFKEFSDMRKLLSEVLSFTLLPDQIKDLRKEFEIMDTDGTGEISLDNLKQVLLINAGAGSLGALTEEEVVDIFNAMRVNKEETTIHWHEFIAAGLTQCRVDDRNLRLAFDRLDRDHKGYIALNDIINLVGSESMANEKEMRDMWTDSMSNVGGTQRHITYDHFLLIMKGQTQKVVLEGPMDLDLGTNQLESVLEHTDHQSNQLGAVLEHTDDHSTGMTAISGITGEKSTCKSLGEDPHYISHSSPNIGVASVYDTSDKSFVRIDSPLSSPIASSSRLKVDIDEKAELNDGTVPLMPQPEIVSRKRSQSLEQVMVEDTRPSRCLPEKQMLKNMNDESANKSALSTNRDLYRSHRQMRISVLEGSRHFEEKQAIRARDTLMKKQVKEAMGAGLVMRHGTKLQVTSEAIRTYLDEAKEKQKVLLEKANRRGGRGRRNRKKTISDMSAMMNPSMGQEEMGGIAAMAVHAQTPDSKRSTIECSFDGVDGLPDLSSSGKEWSTSPSLVPKLTSNIQPRRGSSKRVQIDTSAIEINNVPTTPDLPEIDLKCVREPTVPGQFQKTVDPFSASGMYRYDTES